MKMWKWGHEFTEIREWCVLCRNQSMGSILCKHNIILQLWCSTFFFLRLFHWSPSFGSNANIMHDFTYQVTNMHWRWGWLTMCMTTRSLILSLWSSFCQKGPGECLHICVSQVEHFFFTVDPVDVLISPISPYQKHPCGYTLPNWPHARPAALYVPGYLRPARAGCHQEQPCGAAHSGRCGKLRGKKGRE